jgi:hypothetical protein
LTGYDEPLRGFGDWQFYWIFSVVHGGGRGPFACWRDMKKSELDPNPSVAIPVMPVICDKCRAEGTAGDAMFAAIPDILNFEPVPRRAQVNSWSAEHQRAFIAALAITGSAKKAAATIGRHAFGADQLRKARGGKSFSEAWDAALDVARERELARVYENLSELQAKDEAANARGQQPAARIDQPYYDDDSDGDPFEAMQEVVRERILRARRLLLFLLTEDEEMQRAWEVLVGPVDWEKARRNEPQDNEPFPVRMSEPGTLLTAEAGLLPDITGGPDVLADLCEQLGEPPVGQARVRAL